MLGRGSGDLLRLVSLNMHLDWFFKEILNLVRESSYLVHSLCYSHFDIPTLKMGLIKVGSTQEVAAFFKTNLMPILGINISKIILLAIYASNRLRGVIYKI
jgi:hypothetical protein